MRVSTRATCFWPGLTRLWLLGEWSGLLVAFLFAVALNAVLAASFLWPTVLPAGFRGAAWVGLIGFWGFSVVRSQRAFSGKPVDTLERPAGPGQGLFLQAQGEYLRGHWYEAESHLKELLRLSDKDVDARLMLATLYRRTKRVDDARQQLRTLERTAGSDKWQCEIAHERHLLKSAIGVDAKESQASRDGGENTVTTSSRA